MQQIRFLLADIYKVIAIGAELDQAEFPLRELLLDAIGNDRKQIINMGHLVVVARVSFDWMNLRLKGRRRDDSNGHRLCADLAVMLLFVEFRRMMFATWAQNVNTS